MTKTVRALGLLLITIFLLSACDSSNSNSSSPNQSNNPGGNANDSSNPRPAPNLTVRPGRVYNCLTDAPNPAYQTIRLGLTPIPDALPIYAACLRGFYDDENINVQFVPFTNEADRDAAFKSGAIDAEIGDMVVSANLSKGDLGTTVAVIFETNPNQAVFSVLAAPGSAASTIADLKGKQIALADNTISDYLADYLFARQGLDKSKGGFTTQGILDPAARLTALQGGKVAAAVLPEPFASVAISAGAKLIDSDKGSDLGAESVLIFNKQYATTHGDAVRHFLNAYYRITADINTNFDSYRKVLLVAKIASPALAKTLAPISFAPPRVPTADEIKAVSYWAKQRGIISTDLVYSKVVDDSYLPKRMP